MKERLPFYMVYQEPFGVDDVRKAREDYDYMKSIYPDAAKRLMPFVEEECDRLMYNGSMIYDEYRDQLQLRLMCKRICERAKEGEEKPGQWFRDLAQVMVCQELCQRRAEYRRYRKTFYMGAGGRPSRWTYQRGYDRIG